MKRKIVVASNLLEKKNYGDYTFPIDFDYNTLFMNTDFQIITGTMK